MRDFMTNHDRCIYVLNEEQWAHFMEAMTTPREPTEAMKLAVKRFNELAQRKTDTGTDVDRSAVI